MQKEADFIGDILRIRGNTERGENWNSVCSAAEDYFLCEAEEIALRIIAQKKSAGERRFFLRGITDES